MTARYPVALMLLAAVLSAMPSPCAAQSRLKDVVSLQGAQSTPLIGYGLVIGLNKTGDRRQTLFSAQSLANMLQRMGVVVPGGEIKVENVAAVLVTAELLPYTKPGARLDVTVSSVGDARSLQGGTLVATPLRGPDGTIYALATGPLSLGGFGGGKAGNSVQVNHLTAGRVPGGGLVQTASKVQMSPSREIVLSLHEPDFVSASHVAQAVNRELDADVASAADAASVVVAVPESYRQALPDLMARLEPIPVDVDVVARVVMNERTGTVVVGSQVRLAAAAVAHGNLSVRISTQYDVSQPAPFSQQGQTVVVPQERVDVDQGEAKLVALEEGVTLLDVVRALNALGATPRDIIAIMQALKTAGALKAELVIM